MYAGVHSYMGGCPTTTTGFGGGYPYHHHHGFGAGAGVPGSPLPTTTIFHDFFIFRILSDLIGFYRILIRSDC